MRLMFLRASRETVALFRVPPGAGVHFEDAREDAAVQLLLDERQHRTRLLSRRHARHGVREGIDIKTCELDVGRAGVALIIARP